MAELELYWFTLTAPPDWLALWRSWLSPQERARAKRFTLPAHGEHFVAARAQLRWLLARRLGCDPGEVRFNYGTQGKPELAQRPLALHFNLSHSGELGLLGLHPGSELGVDIERDRPQMNSLGLARRFFTAREAAWLAGLEPEARPAGFGRLWTCKEAWMKSDGRGMTLPLHQVEVGFDSDSTHLRAVAPPRRKWWVQELAIAGDYRAAVVMAAPPAAYRLQRLAWPAVPAPPANAPAPARSGP